MPKYSFQLKINEFPQSRNLIDQADADLILSIKINIDIKENKKLISCYAYLTEGIPIVEIVFSIIDISKLEIIKSTEFYRFLEKFININTKEYIFIHRFTNFNNERECSEKYRGLGKKCIKECLKYCCELYSIETQYTPIILECSGDIPQFLNRYEELKALSKFELLHLFEKYDIINKKDYEDYLSDKKIKNRDLETYSREELLENFSELIIDFENNNELSKYYSRNFNLEILDDSNIYYKTMGCFLNDFIL